MSMSMGIAHGEAIACLAERVASSRDRRREEPWISLDRLKKESRIRASLELRAEKINSLRSNCRKSKDYWESFDTLRHLRG